MSSAGQVRKVEWVATSIQNLGVETCPFISPDSDSGSQTSCSAGKATWLPPVSRRIFSPLHRSSERAEEGNISQEQPPLWPYLQRAFK